MYATVSAAGSMRLTRRFGSFASTAAATCAAGSVVVRCTRCPRRASSMAMRRGDGRLADAALAHRHDHALAGPLQLRDQVRQRRRIEARGQRRGSRAPRCRRGTAAAPRSRPGCADDSGTRIASSSPSPTGIAASAARSARVERERHAIVALRRREHAVDDEPLIADAERRQLAARPLRLVQRRRLGTRHEHERRRACHPRAPAPSLRRASVAPASRPADRDTRPRPDWPAGSPSTPPAATAGAACGPSAPCRR